MARNQQRQMRNFLIDRRFQLKYTGMVLAVTMTVAGVLGYFAYRYSKGQTEALTAQIALQPELNPKAAEDLQGFAEREDRKVANAILVGVLILVVALGVTGIVVTHRVVGPAYRMRRLFDEVGGGRLHLTTGIRHGDELQELYRSFSQMVESLRDQRSEEVEALEETLTKMESAGVRSDYLLELRPLLERLRRMPFRLPLPAVLGDHGGHIDPEPDSSQLLRPQPLRACTAQARELLRVDRRGRGSPAIASACPDLADHD